ncbi:hypothetical protein TNCV_4972411 [Trichonephila clavipes]|nr:hypothetical protein TNCV_4972411 [Trichonephila clavipes]
MDYGVTATRESQSKHTFVPEEPMVAGTKTKGAGTDPSPFQSNIAVDGRVDIMIQLYIHENESNSRRYPVYNKWTGL